MIAGNKVLPHLPRARNVQRKAWGKRFWRWLDSASRTNRGCHFRRGDRMLLTLVGALTHAKHQSSHQTIPLFRTILNCFLVSKWWVSHPAWTLIYEWTNAVSENLILKVDHEELAYFQINAAIGKLRLSSTCLSPRRWNFEGTSPLDRFRRIWVDIDSQNLDSKFIFTFHNWK